MRPFRFLIAAALMAAGAAAQAAGGQDVNLDGSARPHKKGPLAAAAASQLRQDRASSPASAPVGVKAQADADIAARDARAKGPRLKVERQNLKGQDAARDMAAQQTPNTIDHDTAYGDKDHTQQVTDLKISVKK